jgi:hypothetical protein
METLADWKAILEAFFATPAGIAVKALGVGTFLTFGLGVFAALRDGTFEWKYVDVFVRTTLWGRVVPVLFVLMLGYVSGIVEITGAGIVAGGVVAAGMIQAAIMSIAQLTKPKEESAATNAVPGTTQ